MTPSEPRSLMLLQQVAMQDDACLHCREISLDLSEDQQHLILSRYSERYSPDGMEWLERKHQVPIAELLRWVIEEGQPPTLLQSDPSAELNVAAH